jgi:glycosyltransferase involved in cell wall biosynthesis
MTSTLLAERASDACREPVAAGRDPIERNRILLVVHSAKTGGAERMALLEAEYLEDRFELLISVPDGPLRSRFAAHGELVDSAATLPLWGESLWRWLASSARTALDAIRMAVLIRRRGVELVLTNSSVCLAPVIAACLARVPVVVHARDVPKSRLAPLVFALHGALASTVVVITDGLAPYFRRGRRTRIATIADGIVMPSPPSSSPLPAPPMLAPSSSSLPAPPMPAPSSSPEHPGRTFHAPLRLCLIGGVDPRKGQDIAVAVLAQLRDRGVAATLEFVGREVDREFAASVRDAARRLGVEESVAFAGEVADAGPHLERSDIVIAPSRGEWTPLALMEALARGLPVVAAQVGGVREIVSDRESGLLVAPEDPAAMTAAILELLAQPAAAAEMARRGRDHVDANFRVERTLERLQAELSLLLGDEPEPAAREPGHLQAVL